MFHFDVTQGRQGLQAYRVTGLTRLTGLRALSLQGLLAKRAYRLTGPTGLTG